MLDGDRAAKSSSGESARALKPPKEKKDKPARRRKVRRRILQVAAVIILLPLILIGAGLVYAQSKFSQIERVEVAQVLDGGGGNGQNILLVGSDAGEDRTGQRSDTIMLLRLEPDAAKIMSIPRDLFVTIQPSGREQRINAAYNDGPSSLIQTVQDSLGIPVHRYMEVDFVTFASLVDAIGGVTIEFPHPAFDEKAGLRDQRDRPRAAQRRPGVGVRAVAYLHRDHRRPAGGRPHVRSRTGSAPTAVHADRVRQDRRVAQPARPDARRDLRRRAACASTTT